jgi:hypothetical protein
MDIFLYMFDQTLKGLTLTKLEMHGNYKQNEYFS